MERGQTNQPETLEAVTEMNPLISKARDFAKNAHKNQKRKDGSPYFTHCEAVARIVCEELRITDQDMLAAAYIHDTVEDTETTLEEIQSCFGLEVARLVDGVTKIRQEIREEPDKEISKKDRDRLTEIKVISESNLDPRVGILKAAADRLHNMRTLEFVPIEKQTSKALETLRYAKLLESLGVWIKMKEIEDLALKYIDPDAHKKFAELITNDKRTDPLFIENMVSKLQTQIPSGIRAEVDYRVSGISRLIHKMGKTPDMEVVNDVISFRVIVDDDNDGAAADKCYQILRVLQEEFANHEDRDRFDNFYFRPTDNGYSALQMTINTPNGAVEIAITSKKKEDFNNWGVVSQMRRGQKELSQYSRVLVFTPEGDVKFFPPGATAIDFAYSIHPSFGVRANKAIIDGEEREMTYVIKNGQSIHIELGPDRIAPDIRWQNPDYCLPDTLAIINEQILNQGRHDKIVSGIGIATPIIQNRGLIDLIDLLSFEKYKEKLINMLFHIGCKGSLDNLYYQIGVGYITPEKLDKCLDDFGISAKELNLCSFSIRGVDRPGILELVGTTMKSSQGNVGALNLDRQSTNGVNAFDLRLVVEGLTTESAEQLKSTLLEGEGIQEVIIV